MTVKIKIEDKEKGFSFVNVFASTIFTKKIFWDGLVYFNVVNIEINVKNLFTFISISILFLGESTITILKSKYQWIIRVQITFRKILVSYGNL